MVSSVRDRRSDYDEELIPRWSLLSFCRTNGVDRAQQKLNQDRAALCVGQLRPTHLLPDGKGAQRHQHADHRLPGRFVDHRLLDPGFDTGIDHPEEAIEFGNAVTIVGGCDQSDSASAVERIQFAHQSIKSWTRPGKPLEHIRCVLRYRRPHFRGDVFAAGRYQLANSGEMPQHRCRPHARPLRDVGESRRRNALFVVQGHRRAHNTLTCRFTRRGPALHSIRSCHLSLLTKLIFREIIIPQNTPIYIPCR